MHNKLYAIIIEDDPKLSSIFQTALEQAGFETAVDLNGDRYPLLLDKGEPALVILDLHLPFASGIDILEAIRTRYADTVIAIVTADFIKAKTLTGQGRSCIDQASQCGQLVKNCRECKEIKP